MKSSAQSEGAATETQRSHKQFNSLTNFSSSTQQQEERGVIRVLLLHTHTCTQSVMVRFLFYLFLIEKHTYMRQNGENHGSLPCISKSLIKTLSLVIFQQNSHTNAINLNNETTRFIYKGWFALGYSMLKIFIIALAGVCVG